MIFYLIIKFYIEFSTNLSGVIDYDKIILKDNLSPLRKIFFILTFGQVTFMYHQCQTLTRYVEWLVKRWVSLMKIHI